MSRVWFVERTNARKHTCALLSVPSALDSYGGEQQLSLIGMRLPQFSAARLYLQLPRPGQEIYIDRSLPCPASRKMCFFTHLLQKCGTNKSAYYGYLFIFLLIERSLVCSRFLSSRSRFLSPAQFHQSTYQHTFSFYS